VLQSTIDRAVNTSYIQALEQENITPISQPNVELGDVQLDQGLKYEAVVDVMPIFDLPDYKTIAKKVQKVPNAVTEDEVQEAKQYLLKSRGTKSEVDRKAQTGDLLTIKYTLTVDNTERDTSEDMSVELGGGRFIPGFEDELIGLKAGDEKSFTLTFPAEYQSTDLAGKPGTFVITVKKVEETVLPEFSNEFVSEMTSGKTKTVNEMEASIREGIQKEKDQESETQHKQDIMDAIMKEISVEIPTSLIDSEKERIIQEMEQRAVYSGDTFDAALERAGKTREEFLSEATPQAKSRVLLMLTLRKIAEEEALKPDSGQVATQMMNILSQYPQDQIKDIDQDRLRLMIEGEMTDKLTLDFLASI